MILYPFDGIGNLLDQIVKCCLILWVFTLMFPLTEQTIKGMRGIEDFQLVQLQAIGNVYDPLLGEGLIMGDAEQGIDLRFPYMLKYICFLRLSLVSITVSLLKYEIATVPKYSLHLVQNLAHTCKMMQSMGYANSIKRFIFKLQILSVHLKESHGFSFKPLFCRFHLFS